MQLTNREWVGRGLEILARGLGPYVDRHMAAFWPGSKSWLEVMVGRARQDGRWPMLTRSDARLLLRVIDENPKAYLGSLSKLHLAYVREIREIANRWAHFESFPPNDVRRALDTILRLLRAVDAPTEAGDVSGLLAGFEGVSVLVESPAQPGDRSIPALPAGSGTPAKTLDAVSRQSSTVGTQAVVAVFRKQDADYLAWVRAHQDGYVLNTGPEGGGNPVLHRAVCSTITRTPPFTSGYYIKVCSTAVGELDEWTRVRRSSTAQRCGLCHPPGGAS